MFVRPKKSACAGLVAALFAGLSPALADDAATLSTQMLAKLEVDKAKRERNGEFDDALEALKRAGYIHKRRDAKEDYSAMWKVLKPLDVFGNRVLVVSNEEEGAFIGCCMQNLTTILVEATGDVGKLRDFAKANGCRFEHDEQSDQETLKETLKKLRQKSEAGRLAQLSCSANLSQ